MCLTAKPTWEWIVSIFQFPAVIAGAAVGALILLSLLFASSFGPWSAYELDNSTQSDRGPDIYSWCDGRPPPASPDPDRTGRAGRRRPQPRADPVRGQAPVPGAGRLLRVDGRDRQGRGRRQGDAVP